MADMIKPFSIVVDSDNNEDKKVTTDFSFFQTENAKVNLPAIENVEEGEEGTKRRGRPPKHKNESPIFVPANSDTLNNSLPFVQTNEPYINTYGETNGMLKTSIAQIDMLSGEIKNDIDSVRSSKTLKNKYTYITDLTGTESSLLSAKISAIREINSSITHAHDLDIKRIKELKLSAAQDEQNDDKKIMDMYSAFVNTPVGIYGSAPQLAPPIQDMTMAGVANMIRAEIGGENADVGQMQYMNNLSPEQNRMRLEGNPNVQTVVVFNQETGQRFFDVIDVTTGQSVPNYSRPDAFLLENTTIDVNRGVARNTDIDQTYNLVVIGNNNAAINEY